MGQPATILIVDDMEVNRVILHELFADHYAILEACDGEEALQILQTSKENIVLLLLDLVMPKKNGYEVLQSMQELGLISSLPVIVITVMGEVENEVRAFELGAADLILKPFEPMVVLMRVKNVLNSYCYKQQMENTISAQKKLIQKSYNAMLDTLKKILDHRNMESGEHVLRIQTYTRILLTEEAQRHPELHFNRDYIDLVAKAAMLHDVGKIMIPDQILNKPARLSQSEFAVMKTHSEEGCNILNMISQVGNREFLQCAYDICLHHHERWDGTGYPYGLKHAEISCNAQVVGIADAYDALLSERSYKPAYSHEKTVSMILNGECGTFSEEILDCFQKVAPLLYEASLASIPNQDQSNEVLDRLEGVLGQDQSQSVEPIDSYQYYALLQYLGSSVFTINFETGRYKQNYPTYLEFSQLEPEGVFKEEFLDFLYNSVCEASRDELIRWTQSAALQIRRRKLTTISANYQFFNRIYQAYQWYQITLLCVEVDVQSCKKMLFIFKNIQEEQAQKPQIEESTPQNDPIITRYQQENEELKIRAEVDQLTGIYNKITVQTMIDEQLSRVPEQSHALLILDIDNFKQINDTLGHLAGDKALSRFAQNLKEQFRSSDMIGRIGGDEFAIFLANIPNEEWVSMKVQRMITAMNACAGHWIGELQITMSVGVALYPCHGNTFHALYQKADQALYLAKSFGKNQFRFYSEKLPNTLAKARMPDRIEGIPHFVENFNKQLPYYFFAASDKEEAFNTILDITARYYGLLHIVIAPMEQQKILFQWNGHAAQTPADYAVDIIDGMLKSNPRFMQGTEKVFCRDVKQLNYRLARHFQGYGVEACMIAPILYQDAPQARGAVIFTRDKGPYQWSEKEIEACELIAKMVAQLLQTREALRYLRHSEQLRKLFCEHIGSDVYVIDSAYHLRDINEPIGQLSNRSNEEKCYHRFYGLEAPCRICPVRQLSKSCTQSTLQKYDPVLKKQVSIQAVALDQDEADALYCIIKGR